MTAAPAALRRAARTARNGVRRIGYDERHELKHHLLRLSACQRRMRFNGGVSDEFIAAYCRGVPGARSMVVGHYADDTLRGAAELFMLTDNAPRRSCEIALSVEESHQGRGVGTELVNRMLVLASNRRVRTIRVLYGHGNKRMANIARRFGAAVNTDGSQSEAVIRVPPPDDLSIFEEAMTGGARRGRGRASFPDSAAAGRSRIHDNHRHR